MTRADGRSTMTDLDQRRLPGSVGPYVCLFPPPDNAFELCCFGHGVRDRAVFANVGVQKLNTPIGFIRVNDKFIVHRNHLRWTVLPGTVQLHFHTQQIKLEHRRRPLDALDHASGDGGEEELRRVEGIRPAIDVRVEDNFGVFGGGDAAMQIDALGADLVLEHSFPS